MDIEQILYIQLEKMGCRADGLDMIRTQSGISVARAHTPDGTRILKYFDDPDQRREIGNYRLLKELGVPTLKIYAATDEALLMEDMEGESMYRLGTGADMADTGIARNLAAWYRILHEAGRGYVRNEGKSLYSELDYFTPANIEDIAARSDTDELPVWKLLRENYGAIAEFMESLALTLTYNDFYYTNLAVARDNTAAIMFDYNLLGRGSVLMDIRNVRYSLSAAAGDAFSEAYGRYDFEKEILLDDVISPVITLAMAYRRSTFPDWARESLEDVKGGYIKKVETLLEAL